MSAPKLSDLVEPAVQVGMKAASGDALGAATAAARWLLDLLEPFIPPESITVILTGTGRLGGGVGRPPDDQSA